MWYIPAMSQTPSPATKKNIPAMLADTDMLFRQAKQGPQGFDAAKPFPHVLLPGLVKASCRVALCEGLREWQRDPHAGFYPQGALPSVVHWLLGELSSSTLIRHFASLTGTGPLLPDPFWLGGGPQSWQDETVVQEADRDFFPRHPKTDLQNVIRLEIFVADEPHQVFPLELSGAGQPPTFYSVSSGTAVLTASQHYRMIKRSSSPQHWCSLVTYYYVNDRARTDTGQEHSHGY